MNYDKEKKALKKFKRYVIWGLRRKANTFRYIHGHFYQTLRKLEQDTIWIEDEKANQSIIHKGDLVISAGMCGDYMPIVKGAYYCLHNFNETIMKKIEPDRKLILQVYTNDAGKNSQKWDTVRFFDRKKQVLYQPWGTNLLPHEFKNPVFSSTFRFVFWIGSIWDNKLHQGNITEIKDMKKVLFKKGLWFIHFFYGISDIMNIKLIRWSRIAPAIAGNWQVQVNYLPCRMFKNISFGQLGFSNVSKFQEIFPGLLPKGGNIGELIETVLSIPKQKYLKTVKLQQEIAKKYTYIDSLKNILRAFEEIHV